jgi:hypothetical protein
MSIIKLEDLSRKEIINLIGYSLFGIPIENIEKSSKYSRINFLLRKLEEKLEYKFNENNDDRYLYKTWGKNFIHFNFRPLFLQIIIKLILQTINYYFIYKLKFKFTYCSENKLSFIYKIDDPNKETIFFIHGFGFGYIPYINTLIELNENYNLIIIILPSISSYTYYSDYNSLNANYFPELNQIRNHIYEFLESNNCNNVILLSHSFGTYITQILRQDEKSKIFKKIIMIDPIIFWSGCFKMSLHISNPLVRKEKMFQYLIDNLINYLIYKCIYLKYVCYRVMFGPDFWVYDSKEIKDTNLIMVFEKNDYVIPAEMLYIKAKDDVTCFFIDEEEAVHGSILIEKKYIDKLKEIIGN